MEDSPEHSSSSEKRTFERINEAKLRARPGESINILNPLMQIILDLRLSLILDEISLSLRVER